MALNKKGFVLTSAAHILKLTRKGYLAATPRGGGGELGGSLLTARDGVGLEAWRGARGEGARSLREGIWIEEAQGLFLGSGGQPQAYLGSGYTGPELAVWEAMHRYLLPGPEGSSQGPRPKQAQGLLWTELLFAGEKK